VITQASAATHTFQAPDLFMLTWGLIASAFALLTVTNFRGFADKYARRWAASSARQRKLPPWRSQLPQDPAEQTRRVRLLAIPFAVAGPVVTVIGIVSIRRGGTGASEPALPSPYCYLLIGFAAVGVAWSWRSRSGLFWHSDWHHGWRLGVALLSSVGLLVFGTGLALGQLTLAVAGMAVGAAAFLILVMRDPR
jgi:hypothetical protein